MSSQMTQLIMAQRGFQASVQVTKNAQDTYTAALQIGRALMSVPGIEAIGFTPYVAPQVGVGAAGRPAAGATGRPARTGRSATWSSTASTGSRASRTARPAGRAGRHR